ncbi:tRNA-binding protein [Flavobacterium agricola]|uniref:tRNA-binding protein n=1 Tax=Flavobacterium agricola TaxID=2870839 RepID=A0ABY6M0T9_9FLAO|nr:tRNA-binding protein [Flavobacterium agricola]UYW02179.1 tRNA-binding protein [Flavobacterium agricola]
MKQKPNITWQDFEKVDIRVGTIKAAKIFEKAKKPAFQLEIDFGSELGIKKSSAQITDFYMPEQLINQQIIAVINFDPKQIANFMSECLVLGILNQSNQVTLIQPNLKANNGDCIA